MKSPLYQLGFDRLEHLSSRVLDFWFEAIDPIRLRVFEQVFTSTFLIYVLHRFQYAREWLTPYGFHLTPNTAPRHLFDPFPLLPEAALLPFGFLMFGSILAVILGWRRNLFIWVVLGCAVYVQHADFATAFVKNNLYIFGFSLLACSGGGRCSKVLSGLDRPTQSAWGVRTLQASLLIQYFTAGTCKIIHGDWLTCPDALWTHVQGIYRTDFAAFLLRVLPKDAWSVGMYSALFFELFAVVMFTNRRTRRFGLLFGLGFHLMIMLLMHNLVYFSIQMVCFYVLFLRVSTLRRLEAILNLNRFWSGSRARADT